MEMSESDDIPHPYVLTFEPCHENKGFLPLRKQRRRSAMQ